MTDIPLISAMPPAPIRGDAPENYMEIAAAWATALPLRDAERNAQAAAMNTVAGEVADDAASAAAAAATATAAANVAASATTSVATSETAHDLNAGAKVFVLNEAGRGFLANQELVAIRRGESSVRLLGTRGTYSASNLTLNVTSSTGAAGSYTDWIIFPAAWASAPVATKEEIWAGTAGLKLITPEVNAASLAYQLVHASEISGGSITLTGLRGINRKHFVTATTLIALPANVMEGQTYTLDLFHLGTGAANFAVTFNENFLWGDAGTPTMPAGVNKRLFVTFHKDADGKYPASYKRYA